MYFPILIVIQSIKLLFNIVNFENCIATNSELIWSKNIRQLPQKYPLNFLHALSILKHVNYIGLEYKLSYFIYVLFEWGASKPVHVIDSCGLHE